ncbi:unnamed protein product [marine sediment metagenome]|uniref:Uncharacterized protein n=1 Tax=marine sediment metagenome TaxID=412755 RepID=X1N9F5_9ZZZZ
MNKLKFRPMPMDEDGNQCKVSKMEIPMIGIEEKRRGDLETIMNSHKEILLQVQL